MSAKIKVDVENSPTTKSAVSSGDFAEELTCLLCSELFKDPVMVECGHNFCRNCIDKAWNGQESFTCPDCKEVITDKRYTTNRALANLVKKTVGTTAAPAKPTEKPKPAENCPEHDERLKLYCKDDGTLSCVICRDSLKHASHNFLPILDAVGVYRTELSAIVAPLEEALKVTEQLTSQQSEKVEQHKNNVSKFREHIVSEFDKLRSFLKEREEKLLDQLQEQGESLLKEMEANVVKMQENQDNIKETITMANERMNDTDSIFFLTGIKSFIEKCQDEQQDVMVSGNTLLSKDLCQGTFKGPIQYSVWNQMKSFIQPCEKLVWIVGHSYVNWAARLAAKHSDGLLLGLPKEKCTVKWFGREDLQWKQLHRFINEIAEGSAPPDVIVVHAGGNDLGRLKSLQLITDIWVELGIWLARWPEVVVMWSCIVPRRRWRYAESMQAIERCRKKVNKAAGDFVLARGGAVIKYDNLIDYRCEEHFHTDESLSNIGLDIFNNALQEALKKWWNTQR
ncbi:nuclear factor 7, ovary-like isoform X1 [Dendropsophus ebraccatus]|uniref:nuclear factor 7, ovary-like isoform X1 n=1 Tax=Dendropsophus ebraccatus TaxID=150705 RepID=UPI003831B956